MWAFLSSSLKPSVQLMWSLSFTVSSSHHRQHHPHHLILLLTPAALAWTRSGLTDCVTISCIEHSSSLSVIFITTTQHHRHHQQQHQIGILHQSYPPLIFTLI